ncbi:MAG: hypothetical protein ABL956_17235 [Hyphomonadaceae bacterium]
MSTAATGAIGPISVRYATQIRELLQAQAVQRMAADEEAARAAAQAERDARADAASKAEETDPTKVEGSEPTVRLELTKTAEPKTEPAPAGLLVDIQV